MFIVGMMLFYSSEVFFSCLLFHENCTISKILNKMHQTVSICEFSLEIKVDSIFSIKLKSLHRYCSLPDGPAVRFNYVPRVVFSYDGGRSKRENSCPSL